MQTVCAYCGVGCKFEVKDKKLKPVKEYPSNSGMACAKGLSSLKTIDKNRLLDVSINGKKSSYAVALNLIAEKIKNTDPKKIGFYLSGQLLNEDYYVANKLAKGFVKTANCDTNSRTCMASAVVGYKKSFGVDYVPVRIEDIDKANLLILIGANPAASHIVLFNKIKKAKKRGLKVVVIDPRFTQTAKIADIYLPIKVGSDIDLLNILSKKLIQEEKIDNSFIEKFSNGYSEYKELILELDETTLLKRAGLDKKLFEEFYELFIKSDKIITAWTMGINQSVQGTEKNLAINNLHIITGQINKEGAGPFSLTGQPNAMGGREVGGLSTTLAVHLDFDDESVKRVEEFWKTKGIPKKRGLTAYEMIQKADQGELKLLIISHTDPVYHLPNRHFVENAFKKIDLIVEINAYNGSEISKFSHIKLPALPFGEKEGTQTNLDRTLTHSARIEKREEILQDWEIFAKLGKLLGYEKEFDFKSSKNVFDEYKKMTRLSKDAHLNIYEVDYESLKNKPFVWGENLFKDNIFMTPTKKANLVFVENKNLSEQPSSKYPFLLLTGRTKDQWHSGTKTAQLKELLGEELDFMEICEEDAKELGLKDKDKVKVISKRGELTAKVKISNINPKTVFIPITHRDINFLTDDKLDPFSFEPDYNHSAVRLVRQG